MKYVLRVTVMSLPLSSSRLCTSNSVLFWDAQSASVPALLIGTSSWHTNLSDSPLDCQTLKQYTEHCFPPSLVVKGVGGGMLEPLGCRRSVMTNRGTSSTSRHSLSPPAGYAHRTLFFSGMRKVLQFLRFLLVHLLDIPICLTALLTVRP